MKISLDGGQTWTDTESVYVSYEDCLLPGEDERGNIIFNFTYEGLITDIWVDRTHVNGQGIERGTESHNLATESATIDEIIERMVEANE